VQAYTWNDWSVRGFTGVSVWDLMTDWQERLSSYPSACLAYLFPAWSLTGPKKETLQRWDAMNATGRVAGYGEVDNHDARKRVFGREFRIFPFEVAFSTIRTHILVEESLSADGEAACRQVYDAIRGCRLYMAQERWRSAKGFSFTVSGKNGAASTGGDYRAAGTPFTVEVTVPEAGTIRLVRDGRTVAETAGKILRTTVGDAGVYRTEVRRKVLGRDKPWIYSNPVWVHP
jgi:hypothetical protein